MNLLPLAFLLSVLPQDRPRGKGLAKGAVTLGEAASRAQRIPDGSEHEFRGVRFDLPRGWTFRTTDDGADLLPPGRAAKGPVQEKYALIHDAELTSLDGGGIAESVRGLADAVQEGLAGGKPGKATFGDLDGRVFAFAGDGADGKQVVVRVHAFKTGRSVSVLAAMGYADRVGTREADLSAILGSMRTGADAADSPPRNQPPVGPPAAAPAKAVGRTPIAGGTSHDYQGVAFELPRGWTVKVENGMTALVPEGASTVDGYVLVNNPASNRLDGPEVDAAVDQTTRGFQPAAQRQGPPQKLRFGDLDGRLYLYSWADASGRKLEVRVHGFLGRGTSCALVAFGYADALARRQPQLQGILDSMGAAPPGRKPAAIAVTVPQELAGTWVWITNFNATSGGGSQSTRQLTLHGNGKFEYAGGSSSSNPQGGTAGQSYEQGTWSATADSLTLVTNGGARTYRLEKRNHPKNKGDPMIVLDGQAFVTAGPKPPW